MSTSQPGVDHASDVEALFGSGNPGNGGLDDIADEDLNEDRNGDQDLGIDEEVVANQVEKEYDVDPKPYDWSPTPPPADDDEPEVFLVSTYIFYSEYSLSSTLTAIFSQFTRTVDVI